MAVCLCFSLLSARLVEVTVLEPKNKTASGAGGKSSMQRADIVDRNGVIIATNLATASLFANPARMMEKDEAAKKLAKALSVDQAELAAKLKGSKGFVWIKRNLTPDEQFEVNALGIPGIGFMKEQRRVYPHDNLLAHVVGYVGVDNEGLSGVEREYNDLLNLGGKEPLRLSVDVKLQHMLRDQLYTTMKEFQAIGATGMVVDANTGETLAMVSLPDYDPNHPDKANDDQKFNRATLGTYEVGSVFKSFTTAMALDYKSANLTSMYDATAPIHFGGSTIDDFHAKRRVLTVPEIFMYSSNIGTAKMAMDVGTERQKEFLDRLGLFDKIDIDLPEKASPILPKPWRPITSLTVSFGHGIAITPAHVARAFVPIVNGGIMHPLSLVKKEPGEMIDGTRVIKSSTSFDMRRLLRLVVEKGTGAKAEAAGYLVGGKTGTAEKIVNGRYKSGAVLASFIGAFPINDPRYVVIAMLDEPKATKDMVGTVTGGAVAAPVVSRFVSGMGPMLGMIPVDEASESVRQELYVNYQSGPQASLSPKAARSPRKDASAPLAVIARN